jgi:hypothetical protein
MSAETQRHSATILIIDDEPVALRVIVAELNALGAASSRPTSA